ncbi:MCE family protein [Corticibacter populi]|uniref:MCE family protein n=1 Tax=Corticibacter populi TaxID=1550736 RepID=A0A3M6QYT7_9BURK|nr:MlaD family protein [Corticibacter populi]RMX07779.1 MCE family protein [Corticibacter populi]RZS35002.1 phospholipid/cholesterol/gamma-HCH transport system substrate-binding protein [Corticibacter populi]
MENKSHAMAAGIFVLLVLTMLGGLAVWLTRDRGHYETFEMTTRQAVTGLQPQAAVRYKGVSIGKVEAIGFDPEEAGSILIRISVDETTPITQNTFASLGYQGVTGLAYIDLDDATQPLPSLGKSPRGYRRLGMRPSNLSQLAAMGPEVIGDVRETMGRINALLGDENQQVLMGTIGRFGQAAQSTASLAQRIEESWTRNLEPTLTQLGQDMGTNMQALQKAAASLDAMSQEFAKVAGRINERDGVIDQLAQSAQAFAGAADEINGSMLPRVQRTLDEVSTAMQEIGSLARDVGNNPQSFIYGPNTARPGPGEQGYVAPGTGR